MGYDIEFTDWLEEHNPAMAQKFAKVYLLEQQVQAHIRLGKDAIPGGTPTFVKEQWEKGHAADAAKLEELINSFDYDEMHSYGGYRESMRAQIKARAAQQD
jgi:hypothetical protein